MQISRRDLLAAGGLSLITGTRALSQTAVPALQQAPAPQKRLLDALKRNRLPITMNGGVPSGAGWDRLLTEARSARFTLIGEEHGVAETAQFSAALFNELRGTGYGRMAI